MTTPINPNQPNPPPAPTPDGNSPVDTPDLSKIDPTGVWQKFLSVGGNQATAQEVKMFIQGLMKSFNTLIQQQQAAAAKAHQRLKNVAEGKDPDD